MAHELHELSRIGATSNEKLLRGGVRKGQSAGRKANNTNGAMRKAPCAMRLPPGRRRQK